MNAFSITKHSNVPHFNGSKSKYIERGHTILQLQNIYPNEFGYANEPNKKLHRIANKGQYPEHVSLASQDFSKILSLGI